MTPSLKQQRKGAKKEPKYVGCEVCGIAPIITATGLCGPCTFGTADAIGEGEYILDEDDDD